MSTRVARLDGIRAIAVLAVIICHTTALIQLWFGVDLFFVLSGYLITGILRRDRESSRYWSSFYIKRATRILPALAITLGLLALLYPQEWSASWAYCVFFLGNIPYAFRPTTPQQMAALWSLAVEEHYYLLWPLAVRRLDRKWLICLIVLIIVFGIPLRWFATHHFATEHAIYALTPFRLDSIAAGSLLALLLEDKNWSFLFVRASGPLTAGAAFLLALLWVLDPHFYRLANMRLFNSVGYPLVSAMCAGAVAYIITHERSFVSRVLSNRALVWIGAVSYGAYLFHAFFSEMAFAHGFGRGVRLLLVDATLTLGASALSFYFYERPISTWGHRLTASQKGWMRPRESHYAERD